MMLETERLIIREYTPDDFDALYADSIMKVTTQTVQVTITKGTGTLTTYNLPDDVLPDYSILSVLGIQTVQSSVMRICNWMVNGRSLTFTVGPSYGWSLSSSNSVTIYYNIRFLMYRYYFVVY